MIFQNFGQASPSRLLKILWIPVRTATKRASGGNKATNNTAGRRLGPKKGEGEPVTAGQILFRQRGTVWYPGENAGIGRDHTIFAKEPGFLRFYRDPFHPKRKFIGVALKPEYRLPTPHFEPRRRRLGYTLIDNTEVAEFEQSFFKKKEVERSRRIDAEFEKREQARLARFEQFKNQIAQVAPSLEIDPTASRLLHIHQFMRGGHSFQDAKRVVDAHQVQDIDLELKTGRIDQQEHDDLVSKYQSLAETSDAAVMLGPRLDVCAAYTEQELATFRQEIEAKLQSIAGESPVVPEEGTSQQVKAQILEALAAPQLTLKEINHYKSIYIRRPVPVLAAQGQFDKQVKSGKGKLMTVWNDKMGKMQQYFVPENAVMVFN